MNSTDRVPPVRERTADVETSGPEPASATRSAGRPVTSRGRAAARADAAAVEVIRRHGGSDVVQREKDYSVLENELEGRNNVAVLPGNGYHVSIVDPAWSYKFDEFHVTEETEPPGQRGNPHFFFTDDGSYQYKDSIHHGQTRMYWNKIGQNKAEFAKTETHAKGVAKNFLAHLAKRVAAKAAVKPAATSAAAKPVPTVPGAKPVAAAAGSSGAASDGGAKAVGGAGSPAAPAPPNAAASAKKPMDFKAALSKKN